MRTRVGYSGGTIKNPTYYNLADHSETVQIDYDPKIVSYEELIEMFFKGHNVYSRPWSRQYMSAVFYHDQAQKRIAEDALQREQESRGKKVYSQIISFDNFYRAEDYHQKYYLQNSRLFSEFCRLFPDMKAFTDSTAAARANGFVAGFGNAGLIADEIESYGLTEKGKALLRGIIIAPAAGMSPMSVSERGGEAQLRK